MPNYYFVRSREMGGPHALRRIPGRTRGKRPLPRRVGGSAGPHSVTPRGCRRVRGRFRISARASGRGPRRASWARWGGFTGCAGEVPPAHRGDLAKWCRCRMPNDRCRVPDAHMQSAMRGGGDALNLRSPGLHTAGCPNCHGQVRGQGAAGRHGSSAADDEPWMDVPEGFAPGACVRDNDRAQRWCRARPLSAAACTASARTLAGSSRRSASRPRA
jgi:hypothetical protein